MNTNITLLLELYFRDREELLGDNLENRQIFKRENWIMPIIRKHVHLYVDWVENNVYFSKTELRKMLLNFYRPSVWKLYNLLKEAEPSETDNKTKAILEEITKACQICQGFTQKPQSFKVSFPQEIVFKRELALYLIWIRCKPPLHVLDLGIHFSAAGFVNGRLVEAVACIFALLGNCLH